MRSQARQLHCTKVRWSSACACGADTLVYVGEALLTASRNLVRQSPVLLGVRGRRASLVRGAVFEGQINAMHQFFLFERFAQVADHPATHSLRTGYFIGKTGDQDCRYVTALGA